MDQNDRVDAALFTQLIEVAAIPFLGSAAGSALVTLTQWREGNGQTALIWMGAVYAVIALRIWLLRRCRRRLAVKGYNPSEALRFALSSGLSGIVWGMGGFLLVGTDPIAMVITITGIQAMVMGAVLTLGAIMPSFLAFAIPATLPMTVILSFGGRQSDILLSIYSLIFLALMIGIARHYNHSLHRTWQLSFDKEDLVRDLTKAHDRLAILAETDGLTCMANRRRFDEVLATEFSRLQRSGAPLSLILLDVDHFKAFNDTYGHVAGDDCLKKVADVFQGFLHRAPDFAARYGGEEFAGILPETEHPGAVALAERIREEVLRLAIPHQASTTAACVTVSLGVVTLDCATIHSPADIVSMTDRQLYQAKSDGRNRVVAWNGIAERTGTDRALTPLKD